MRKESSNQFTEGLVCDLNPINTPNTVLTDALNATIITYDGNEFSLQNDRGNYPLENCKLKPNYIPVGVKEYGDILYIISYNPLDNHVEIGTYPSPVNIESSKIEKTSLGVDSVIAEINGSVNYSNLIENCQLHIWTTDNEGDSKLYPGDCYKVIEEESTKSPYKYEALEYYIVDENRQKYNIDDLIIKDGLMHPVSWQIPGWLAAQYRLGTFDDFIMSMRSIIAPTLGKDRFFDCELNINFQFRISDKLFLPVDKEKEKNIQADLGIEILFSNGQKEFISLSDSKFIDWYSNSKILWTNCKSVLKNVRFGDTINITATPILNISVDGTTKQIKYDSFVETYSVYFNSIGSYDDFKIGNEIWKFYIEEDAINKLYIEYNIAGPNVTNKSVQLYYRILDLNEQVLQQWKGLSGYTGITNQGVGILEFDDNFEPEGIYLLEFTFYEPNKELEEISDLVITRKLIIASQLFSDFVGEYSNFNDIDFDTWVTKYANSITANNWNISHSPNEKSDDFYQNYVWKDGDLIDSYSKKPIFNNTALNKLWNNKVFDSDKGWISSDEFKEWGDSKINFIAGKRGVEHLNIENDINALTGKLWQNTPEVKLIIKPYINTSKINFETWKRTEIKSILEKDVDVIYGKQKSYFYEQSSSEFTQISGLKRIEKIPLMWLYNRMDWKNLNENSTSKLKVGGYLDMNLQDPSSKPVLKETILQVWEENISIPNAITRAILSALGDNDFGVLGVLMHENDRMNRLIQGNTTLFATEDGNSQVLFTYLVFRQTDKNNNYAILVPFDKGLKSYWNKILANKDSGIEDWWQNESNIVLNTLHDFLKDYTDNLKICTSKNAIRKALLVNISEGEYTDLPICDIEVRTDAFSKWIYGDTGIDLLNFNSRNSLIQKFGTTVCGKLLSGSTNSIPEISFYSTTIDKANSIDLEDVFDVIDKNVSIINSSIKEPELINEDLVEQMKDNGNTKGVYWINGNTPKLIELLNRSYKNSDSNKLILNTTDIVQLYTDVGDDHNKLYLGWVENSATVE